MKWIRIPLFFAAVNSANADPWIKCEHCTSQQMLAKSQLHVLAGDAVVYDAAIPIALRVVNEQVNVGGLACHDAQEEPRTAAKTAGPVRSSGNSCFETISHPAPLTLEDATLLNALHEFHVHTGGRMKGIIELRASDANLGPGPISAPAGQPPGFGPSAADYANNVAFRASMNDYASRFTRRDPSISQILTNTYIHVTQPWNVITSAASTFWLGEDATVTVVISFDDGSRVELNFEFETPKTARDAVAFDSEGRDIMTASNIAQFSDSTFPFSNGGGAALENWIRNAIHLGVPVGGILSPLNAQGCRRIIDGVSCTRLTNR